MKITIYVLSLFIIIPFSLNVLTAQNILKIIPLKGKKIEPRAIGVNPVTNTIYVGNGAIHVINGNSNNSEDTVEIKPLLHRFLRGLAVNTVTNRIYVAEDSGLVYVIDGKENKIIDVVYAFLGTRGRDDIFPPFSTAEGVAVNPKTNRIYITHSRNVVTVINGANNKVEDVVILKEIENIQGVEVNPVTNRIYVTGSSLSVLDGETHQVVKTLDVKCSEVDINHITNRIYVVNNSVITVIDGGSNSVIDVFRLGNEPAISSLIGVNVRTNRYYVVNPLFGIFYVIDGEDNKVINIFDLGIESGPQGIGVNPETNLIYVTRLFEDDVIVIKDDGTNSSMGKLFSINCSNNLINGAAGFKKLVLDLDDNGKCVLNLTSFAPGVSIEVSTNLMKGVRSSINIEPVNGFTDSNGEIEFSINATKNGIDWIAWAIPNEAGEFDFCKEAYDDGYAWGIFVEVR